MEGDIRNRWKEQEANAPTEVGNVPEASRRSRSRSRSPLQTLPRPHHNPQYNNNNNNNNRRYDRGGSGMQYHNRGNNYSKNGIEFNATRHQTDEQHHQHHQHGNGRQNKDYSPREYFSRAYDDSVMSYTKYISGISDKTLSEQALSEMYATYKQMMEDKKLQLFFKNTCDLDWMLEKYHPIASKSRMLVLSKERELRLQSFNNKFANEAEINTSLEEPNSESLIAIIKSIYGQVNNQLSIIYNTSNKPAMETGSIYDDGSNKEKAAGSDINDTKYEEQKAVFINSIPIKVTRSDIEAAFVDTLGKRPVRISMSQPNADKRLFRQGWVLLSSEEELEKALEKLPMVQFHGDQTLFCKRNEVSYDKLIPIPLAFSTLQRLKIDFIKMVQITDILDKEYFVSNQLEMPGLNEHILKAKCFMEANIDFFDNHASAGLSTMDKGNPAEIAECKLKEFKQLHGLLALYLRVVHCYCYFQGILASEQDELCRSAGIMAVFMENNHNNGGYKLNPQLQDSYSKASFEASMEASCDAKAALICQLKQKHEGDSNAINEQAKIVENELTKRIQRYVSKIGDERFKCQVEGCGKLFKGLAFLEKHIISKHTDIAEQEMVEIEFYNNFAQDPLKILIPKQSMRDYHAHQRPASRYNDSSHQSHYQHAQQHPGRHNPSFSSSFAREASEYVDLDTPADARQIRETRGLRSYDDI